MDDDEHSGSWLAVAGGGIAPWHGPTSDAAGDADPDDTELAVTPPEVISALGFDPLLITAAEWAEVEGLNAAADRRDLAGIEALLEAAEQEAREVALNKANEEGK